MFASRSSANRTVYGAGLSVAVLVVAR